MKTTAGLLKRLQRQVDKKAGFPTHKDDWHTTISLDPGIGDRGVTLFARMNTISITEGNVHQIEDLMVKFFQDMKELSE